MAGVSVPVTAQPVAPNTVPSIPSTEHSREDRIFNIIQAKLSSAVASVPGQPVPLQPPVVPPVATQPVQTTLENAVTLPADVEINLDEIDFNAPTIPPAAETQKVELTPAEIEARVAAEITAAGAEAESAKFWDKIDGIAVKHPRGKQMVEGMKFMRAIAEPPTEDGKGGVGRPLSVDEIKAADSSHRELQLIRHELASDPASFVNNLVTLAPNGRSWLGDQQVISAVVAELPKILINHVKTGTNPYYGQLITQLADPIFDQFLNSQYQIALSWPGGDPNSEQQKAKDRFLDALQVVEYRIKGSARSLDPASGKENPETEAMRRQLEDSRRRETATRQTQVQQMNEAISLANGRNAAESVDKIFQHYGIDKALSKTTLEPQKLAIMTELDRDLQRLNPGGYQHYQMQLEQVFRGQASPETAKQTYLTLFQNGLKNSQAVRARLSELVKDAKRIVDNSTQRLQASQAQIAPDGTGRMAAASVVPGSNVPIEKWDPKSGMTREEHMAKILATRMMAAPARR